MANPKGGINRQRIDADDAYHRAQARAQDIAKDAEDPQPGPLENRARTANKKTVK